MSASSKQVTAQQAVLRGQLIIKSAGLRDRGVRMFTELLVSPIDRRIRCCALYCHWLAVVVSFCSDLEKLAPTFKCTSRRDVVSRCPARTDLVERQLL
jgi:hypothetical protein